MWYVVVSVETMLEENEMICLVVVLKTRHRGSDVNTIDLVQTMHEENEVRVLKLGIRKVK